MKTFETGFDGITLDLGEIYLAMGYRNEQPGQDVAEMVAETIRTVAPLCRPRFGYELLPVEKVTRRTISVGGGELATGTVITPFLEEAEHLAVFVATAGEGFDKWFHEVKKSGDILKEYLAHAVGSEIAEATARAMAAELLGEAESKGMKISNSYSPGYCGWHVRDQQALFSLLPPRPCGITLTPSCLMLPIKSVSGIIALGRDIEKKAYGCDICNKKDCYKKRTVS